MMRRFILLSPLVFFVLSCSSDPFVGQRFEAERDLWRANWDRANLSLRPQEIDESALIDLAEKYEAVARRGSIDAALDEGRTTVQELQTVAARGLFDAAQIHTVLGDSARAEDLYEELAERFDHLPQVAAEVGLARGALAERRGRIDQAVKLYQAVVDRVDPNPEGVGAEAVVLGLPIQIARLRAQGSPETTLPVHYQDARTYYEDLVRKHAGTLIQLDAQAVLAEVAADLGDWEEASQSLRLLETQILSFDEPPRDPAAIRFALSNAQMRTGAHPESVRSTLTSLLEDYPDCELAPQALLALAANADARDRVDEAIGYLDRLVAEHKEKERITTEALLIRGRLLESRNRWPEALETFRALSSEHPISDAALWVPLEIAQHHSRFGDEEAMESSLTRAEQGYRDFIDKYPPGPHKIFARERLVQTLALQSKYESAIQEMLNLGDDLSGTPRGASHFIAAAGMAVSELADTARAVEILERVRERYSEAPVGDWATTEADRLRGALAQ